MSRSSAHISPLPPSRLPSSRTPPSPSAPLPSSSSLSSALQSAFTSVHPNSIPLHQVPLSSPRPRPHPLVTPLLLQQHSLQKTLTPDHRHQQHQREHQREHHTLQQREANLDNQDLPLALKPRPAHLMDLTSTIDLSSLSALSSHNQQGQGHASGQASIQVQGQGRYAASASHSAPFESALSRWQAQARAFGLGVGLGVGVDSASGLPFPTTPDPIPSGRTETGAPPTPKDIPNLDVVVFEFVVVAEQLDESSERGEHEHGCEIGWWRDGRGRRRRSRGRGNREGDGYKRYSGKDDEEAEAFFGTRSRVVRLPANASLLSSGVFQGRPESTSILERASLWTHGSWAGSVFAVFRTHDEACAALALPAATPALHSDLVPHAALRPFLALPSMTLSEAPTQTYTLSSNPPNPKNSFRLGDWICPSPKCAAHNFGRNVACIGCGCPRTTDGSLLHPHALHALSLSTSALGQSAGAGAPSPRFAPPNMATSTTTYYSSGPSPTTQLSLPNISAGASPTAQAQQHLPPSSAPASSTSFAIPNHPSLSLSVPFPTKGASHISSPLSPHPHSQSSHTHAAQQYPQPSHSHPYPQSSHQHQHPATHTAPTHPLLTPSGRAFAVGGKVQNVSSDPLNPCVMYWPDNEPLPEQGQIRPSGIVGIAQPPILNTGNRGPISHQPGDWICQKCNYLNWRRRKVCQTCLPYAEGNGDSISAAVQAERIALLTSVLSQASIGGASAASASPASSTSPTAIAASNAATINAHPANQPNPPRSHSLTPPHAALNAYSTTGPLHPNAGVAAGVGRTVHRSQSHFALGQAYALGGASPLSSMSTSAFGGTGGLVPGQHHQTLYPASPRLSPSASPIYQTSGHGQGHGLGGLRSGGSGGVSPGPRLSPSFVHQLQQHTQQNQQHTLQHQQNNRQNLNYQQQRQQVRPSPSMSSLRAQFHGFQGLGGGQQGHSQLGGQGQQLYATGPNPGVGGGMGTVDLGMRRASIPTSFGVGVGGGQAGLGGLGGGLGGGRTQHQYYQQHEQQIHTPAPAPLLPSFLQEMVRSPAPDMSRSPLPPSLHIASATATTTTALTRYSPSISQMRTSPTTSINTDTERKSPTGPADLPEFSSVSSEEDGSGEGSGSGSSEEGYGEELELELVSPVSAGYPSGVQVHSAPFGTESGFHLGSSSQRFAPTLGLGANAAYDPFAAQAKAFDLDINLDSALNLDLDFDAQRSIRARGASGSSDDSLGSGGASETWMHDALLRPGPGAAAALGSGLGSIWRLDGEESRCLGGAGAGAGGLNGGVGVGGAFGAVGSGRKTRC
ncbi:unnamed protein product [Cyclocybe aegerita]|uniref:RanBP2-type domain-containing protein n=1 Tax=Cyclocybe aegerita TaxID=1973307 RepID=A0A8S0WP57_CYCAE|nr:unnamed protein product [Cyclocybe aegerita]